MARKTKKNYSVFDHKSVNQIYDEITLLYLEDKRPWVLGFSGGKDSSCALQLIWSAVANLPPAKRTKPVYVVSSDTLVEIPIVASRVITSQENMLQAAEKGGLPFIPVLVTPTVTDTFWVNLLGKGYPAPSQMFRWCTERLKITPTSAFILDKVTQYGEATIVLGARKGESASRDQVLKKSKEKKLSHETLPRHSTLPNSFIYTPIEDFTADDVWQYLLQVSNPWGDDNHDLLAMYRSANAGECPLVIDKSTPSCGNSRFGCWVCTLVKKDKAMEALVDGEEPWLAPLLDFRNLLSKTQDPAIKHKYREYRRRTGQVNYKKDGDVIRGPYKMKYRKDFLRQLLSIERDISKTRPIQLISFAELKEIRRIWRFEEYPPDWEDSVPKIYKEVYGEVLEWEKDDIVDFGVLEMQTLSEVATEHALSESLLRKLLDVERLHHGMSKRPRVFADIDSVLSREWRTEKEILTEIATSKEANKQCSYAK
jgi:DNA sulfur modification protein DndC